MPLIALTLSPTPAAHKAFLIKLRVEKKSLQLKYLEKKGRNVKSNINFNYSRISHRFFSALPTASGKPWSSFNEAGGSFTSGKKTILGGGRGAARRRP